MRTTEVTGWEQCEMASQKRDLAGMDEGFHQQFPHDQVLVCSRILVGMDTEDMQVFTGQQLPCTAEKV